MTSRFAAIPASTLYFSSGRVAASATASVIGVDDNSNEESPVLALGTSSVAAKAYACDAWEGTTCVGASSHANSSTSLTLDSNSLSVVIDTENAPPSHGHSSSQGDASLVFVVTEITSLELNIDAKGRYSVELLNLDLGRPVYLLDSRSNLPGGQFSDSISVRLDPGSYELRLSGMPFAPTAGVVKPGTLRVSSTTHIALKHDIPAPQIQITP